MSVAVKTHSVPRCRSRRPARVCATDRRPPRGGAVCIVWTDVAFRPCLPSPVRSSGMNGVDQRIPTVIEYQSGEDAPFGCPRGANHRYCRGNQWGLFVASTLTTFGFVQLLSAAAALCGRGRYSRTLTMHGQAWQHDAHKRVPSLRSCQRSSPPAVGQRQRRSGPASIRPLLANISLPIVRLCRCPRSRRAAWHRCSSWW